MSKKKVWLIAILSLVFLAEQVAKVQSQGYTTVADVYYQSIAYPESFDQFLAMNRSVFDGQFFSCLTSLEQDWQPRAQQEISICNTHPNPEWRLKCLSECRFPPLLRWSATFRAAVTGTRWSDTSLGRELIWTKSQMPGPWVGAIDSSVPAFRPYFLCR